MGACKGKNEGVCVVIREVIREVQKAQRCERDSCTYPVEVGVERVRRVDGQTAEAGGHVARRQRL